MMKLKLYEAVELTFEAENNAKHLATIKAVFTCGQTTLTIPAYYKQENLWGVRFSPEQRGIWKYTITDLDQKRLLSSGEIECSGEKEGLPPLHIQTVHGRPLFYSGQTPFLMNAYECDWIFALWMKDKKEAKKQIEKICSHSFNTIVFNIYAHECFFTAPGTEGRLVPPPLYCWGGSNDTPDFSVLNEAFFAEFDGLMRYLWEQNIYAIIYYYVYNKCVKYPTPYSAEEHMYLQQVCARYQAFSNVIWNYSKETFHHTDKEHILDGLQLIRETDAYKRLLTFQDDKILMRNEKALKLTDFFSLQHHADFYEYVRKLVWESDRPVFHSEFGYEPGKSLTDTTYAEAQDVREYVMRAWDITFAGAGTCYYYTFTAWDVIRPDDNPPGCVMFQAMHEFMTGLDWWNYIPAPDVPLWTPSRCLKHRDSEDYAFITNHRGKLMLGKFAYGKQFVGEWLNPFTGEKQKLSTSHMEDFSMYGDGLNVFVSPFEKSGNNDYAILKLAIKEPV